MKPQGINQNTISGKCLAICLLILLLLFQDMVYADPEIASKDSKTEQVATTSESKTENLKDGVAPTKENNPMKASLGSASISPNDLSATYSVGLMATNMYPHYVNSGIVFNLVATYNSNSNSNFWGLGSGVVLNVPYMKFGNWIETCRGNCDDNSVYDSTKPLQSKGATGFPKNIYYSSGGTNITFAQTESGPTTAMYRAMVTSNTNYVYRIIATLLDTNKHTYTFKIEQLNNENNYSIFSFNGSANADLTNPSNGQITAIISKTVSKSTLPVNVDYQSDNDVTQGMVIYGLSTEEENTIWLDHIYPDYDLFNEVIPNEPDSSEIIGCFAFYGHYYQQIQGQKDQDIPGFVPDMRNPPNYSLYDSLPSFSNGNYFTSCPKTAFDFSTYKYPPVTYTHTSQANRNVTIRGVNLNNKKVIATLNLTNYDLTIKNLLAEGGVLTEDQKVGHWGDPKATRWTQYLRFVTLSNTTSTVKNAINTLNYVTWNVDGVSDAQTINFNYESDFATSANNISNIGQSYFGLTSSNIPIPLLKKVEGTSTISPVTGVEFEYGTASYNNFYSITSMSNLAQDVPLNRTLVNKYAAIIDKTPIKESSNFSYVKKLTVSTLSGDKNDQITTLSSWGGGESGYNNHYMYDHPLRITSTDDTLAEEDVSIRGMTNFYATTDGLADAKTGEQIVPDKLKTQSYSTIIDNGSSISVTIYNRFGLLVHSFTCPKDYDDDTNKCKENQTTYAGTVGDNADIKILAPKPFELVDNMQNFSQNHNLLSEIKPAYDDLGRPVSVAVYRGSKELLSVNKYTYTDLGESFFNIGQIKSYSRPFIESADINNVDSRIKTMTTYNYKNFSVGDHTYSMLDNQKSQIGDPGAINSRYSAVSYDYNPNNLRIVKTVSCVTPADAKNPDYPQCTLDKAPDRYTTIESASYDDNEQSITTISSTPGADQKVWYEAGTGLAKRSISADGTKQENTYDKYGRIINSKTSILSKSDPAREVVMSDTSTTYTMNLLSNSLTVAESDNIYGSMSLQHYNAKGLKDCELGPNLNTTLDGSSATGYGKSKIRYSYNAQNQLQTTSSYLGDNKDNISSCETGDDGKLISTSHYQYDYINRVTDKSTDVAAYESNGISRKRYQTHTEYSYQDAQPQKNGLWSKILNILNQGSNTSNTLFNITTTKSSSKYGGDDWTKPTITQVVEDIFNLTSTTTVTLPTTTPIIMSTTAIKYNSDKNSSPIVSTNTSFGAPDSVIEYDTLGRTVVKTINPHGSQAQSLSYLYDDLDRVQQVVTNANIKPHTIYYNDDGAASQQIYTYTDTDNTQKNRLTDTNYKESCLLPSPYCSESGSTFKVMQLESINLYTDSTQPVPHKPWVPSGQHLLTTTNTYNKYGLLTDNSITDLNNQNSIQYHTDYDENNQLRVTSQKRIEAGVPSHMDYKYFPNGSVWQTTVDQGNGRPVTQASASNSTYSDASVSSTIDSPEGSNDLTASFTSTSQIDPGSGLTFKTEFMGPPPTLTFNHNTSYNYDHLLRLVNTTVTRVPSGPAEVYESKEFTYCDTTTSSCLYGDLLSQRTYFTDKPGESSNYVEESYKYNPANNYLTQRDTTYQLYSGIPQRLGYVESYGYDDLYRLTHYECQSVNPDVLPSLCAADPLSGEDPVKSRDFTYTIDNSIKTMKTITDGGTSYNHTFNYDAHNTDQLMSISDENNSKVISLDYDPVMARVTSYDQATKTHRDVNYDYNLEGLIKEIKEPNKPGNNANFTRGIDGISNIDYTYLDRLGNESSSVRQNYGGGLYSDSKDKSTFLAMGMYDIPLGGLNTLFKQHMTGLNGREIVTATNQPDRASTLNSYTAYGQMQSFNVNEHGYYQPDNNSRITKGENGANTVASNDQKSNHQIQTLENGNDGREYSPTWGGFLQYDSASPFGGGGTNGYGYGSGNPVGFADPSGHYGSMFNMATYNDNITPSQDIVGAWIGEAMATIFGVIAIAMTVITMIGGGLAGIILGIIAIISIELMISSATTNLVAAYTNNDTLAQDAKYIGYAAGALGVFGALIGLGSVGIGALIERYGGSMLGTAIATEAEDAVSDGIEGTYRALEEEGTAPGASACPV